MTERLTAQRIQKVKERLTSLENKCLSGQFLRPGEYTLLNSFYKIVADYDKECEKDRLKHNGK